MQLSTVAITNSIGTIMVKKDFNALMNQNTEDVGYLTHIIKYKILISPWAYLPSGVGQVNQNLKCL